MTSLSDGVGRWRRLEELFLRALEAPEEERAELLDELTAGDPELRAEVEAMLRAEGPDAELLLERRLSDDHEDPDAPGGEPERTIVQGETLGPYRLRGLLGRGGMGEVYRAWDPRLEREIAIKLLPPDVSDHPDRIARFRREAKALAAIRHPSVVKVFSVEEADGRHFLTMELLDGEPLSRHLSGTGVAPERAARLALDLADALAAAHELGIVHRDLKPGNIMVDRDDKITLLDFGLVKRASAAADEVTRGAGRTRPGAVMGTWPYMSPEQARGEPADPRSDVFSLGIMLYELVTGRRPFEGNSDAEIVAAILHDEPSPLNEIRPEIPGELASIFERCLRKDPTRRYPSASALRDELRRILPTVTGITSTTGAQAAGSRARPRLRALAAAAAGAALIAIGIWWWAGQERERWARVEGVPEVLRLLAENRLREAAELALRVEKVVGADPVLAPHWPRMATPLRVRTEPAGAGVEVRAYDSPPEDWRSLGRSPLDIERFPVGVHRFRLTLQGFETVELARSLIPADHLEELRNAGFDYLEDPSYAIDVTFDRPGSLPEGTVRVSGGVYGTPPVIGFPPLAPRRIPEYLIDRTEVTRGAYQSFVEAGAYEDPAVWTDSFPRDGVEVPWSEAIRSFRDATGRPGPATWSLGQPPPATLDLPVSGVSWFEADAYCRWRRRSLPTLLHWARAALPSSDPWAPFNPTLVRASNFEEDGPVAVASRNAIGVSGAHDLAGNVREWLSTTSRHDTERYLVGGAWSDPDYLLYDVDATSPWRRGPTEGFRCALYPEGDPPPHLRHGLTTPTQDFSARATITDTEFETTRRLFSYDRSSPLAIATEGEDEPLPSAAFATWISVSTPYGERLPIRLHLPLDATSPLQSVVYFPGGNTLRSNARERPDRLDFLLRSGRALVEPVVEGTFQRNDGRTLQRWASPESQQELLRNWIQDLGRTLDFLEQDERFDGRRVAYLGMSLGAALVPDLLAFEQRFAAAVLYSGAFGPTSSQATIDRITALAARVRIPVLMLGGSQDFSVPVEPHQRAFFRAFGTTEEHKRLRVYEAGHWPLPLPEVVRETVDFLDEHLGPIGTDGGPVSAGTP